MKIFVAGLAKTGTTGLYSTIKKSLIDSGGDPICLFEPKNLKPIVNYLANSEAESYRDHQKPFLCKVMLKKFFFDRPTVLDKFDKRVMIVRDPRDRLVSMLLFKALSRPKSVEKGIPDFVKVLEKKESDPSSISFISLCEKIKQLGMGEINIKKSIELLDFQERLIKQHGFFKIFYEDFVDNKTQSLQDYLTFRLINNESQSRWLQHIERSKGHGEWKNWFTNEDVKLLSPLLDRAISQAGYSLDWTVPIDQKINPSSSSKYIRENFPKRLSQVDKSGYTLDKEGFEVLRLRANDGKIDDIFELACLYENGTSFLERDVEMALSYYKLGAVFGHAGCVEKLNSVKINGHK